MFLRILNMTKLKRIEILAADAIGFTPKGSDLFNELKNGIVVGGVSTNIRIIENLEVTGNTTTERCLDLKRILAERVIDVNLDYIELVTFDLDTKQFKHEAWIDNNTVNTTKDLGILGRQIIGIRPYLFGTNTGPNPALTDPITTTVLSTGPSPALNDPNTSTAVLNNTGAPTTAVTTSAGASTEAVLIRPTASLIDLTATPFLDHAASFIGLIPVQDFTQTFPSPNLIQFTPTHTTTNSAHLTSSLLDLNSSFAPAVSTESANTTALAALSRTFGSIWPTLRYKPPPPPPRSTIITSPVSPVG